MKIFLVLFGVLGATAAQQDVGKYGTKDNPATSCKAIFDQGWPPQSSGVYYITTEQVSSKVNCNINIYGCSVEYTTTGQVASQVYCYMEDIPGCGGGGWTTVMKTNGAKTTFEYYSDYWFTKEAYNAKDGGAGDHETKLPTYWSTPFTKLCLGMKTDSTTRWISVDYTATSLYSAIADDKFHKFSVGRDKWLSLIPGSALQENCNREGFNNFAEDNRDYVRIGIVANEQNDCASPDSRIGFGGGGDYGDNVYTGNHAENYDGDKEMTDIWTFGYILVQ